MKLSEKINKKEFIYALCVIVALSFIFFGNGIKGGFVYDDNWVITTNPTLKHISSIPGQFLSSYHYQQSGTGLYRPLTLVSYVLNFAFLGQGAAGFHVVNILLHALDAWLVLFLVYRLFGSRRMAYIASALFFFLPIHVEAITFISGRADLLAFMLTLISLIVFTRDNASRRDYWIASGIFLLSLLSKESVVLFVPLAFLYWLWIKKGQSFRQLAAKIVYFIPPAIIYGILRYLALKENFLANDASAIYNPLKFADAAGRIFTALKVQLLYLWKSFVPVHLSADYSFNQIPIIHNVADPYVLAGLLVLAATVVLIFWRRTRQLPLGQGALWFLASYFVISNFIFSIGTVMAERAFYLPSLGVVLIAAYFIDLLMIRSGNGLRKLWFVLLVLLCLVYGIRDIGRNRVWASNIILYADMMAESPDSVHAKTNAGVAYLQSENWAEGKRLLLESYAVAPDHLPTIDALGIVAEHEQRYSDAEQLYLKALTIKPHYVTSLSNLARMYYQLHQYQKSADLYWNEFNYKHQPGTLLVYAMSESKLGQYDLTISTIKKYYGENPQDLNLNFALGYAYYKKGDKVTADKYFEVARNPAISKSEFLKGVEGL